MPVILANRFATLGNYSHYALPASLASAALLGGVVFSILSNRIRLGVISVVVLFAILTHYSISLRITQEETVVSNFWQEVVWRAPEGDQISISGPWIGRTFYFATGWRLRTLTLP